MRLDGVFSDNGSALPLPRLRGSIVARMSEATSGKKSAATAPDIACAHPGYTSMMRLDRTCSNDNGALPLPLAGEVTLKKIPS
jgi:hypothetical protein